MGCGVWRVGCGVENLGFLVFKVEGFRIWLLELSEPGALIVV